MRHSPSASKRHAKVAHEFVPACPCFVFFGGALNSYSQTSVDQYLVARWLLNGTAADSVGTANGVATNVSWTTDTILGQQRQVAYMGNAGSSISISSNSSLNLQSGGFTIVGWVKSPDLSAVSTVNSYYTLIDSQGVSGQHESAYDLRYSASSLNFLFSTQDVYPGSDPGYRNVKFYKTSESANDLLLPNEWNLIALSYDGSVFRAFVNDEELLIAGDNHLTAGASYISSRPTALGGRADGLTGGYDPENNGYISDVRIYNTALSGGAIASLAGVPEPSTYALVIGAFVLGGACLQRIRSRP